MDENLNSTMDNLTLGIVGLGEIGKEVVRRLAPWGIKILYYDLRPNLEFANKYPTLTFVNKLEDLFATADIVSLHIPLNEHTRGLVGKDLLTKMKKKALLINTARGGVINFRDLLDLLKSEAITINCSFDVYEPEPISAEILAEFQAIAKARPELRFVLIPHNASADADTRGEMACILLEDILQLVKSKSVADLQPLRLIPPQRKFKSADIDAQADLSLYRIAKWWKDQ